MTADLKSLRELRYLLAAARDAWSSLLLQLVSSQERQS